jgi:hypothetical protein
MMRKIGGGLVKLAASLISGYLVAARRPGSVILGISLAESPCKRLSPLPIPALSPPPSKAPSPL